MTVRTTTLCLLALTVFACDPGNDPKGGTTDPCPDYCARLDECGDPAAADCPETCQRSVAWYEYPGEACGALHGEYLECKTAATCEALEGQRGLCQDQLDALISDTCTTNLCDTYADKLIECGLAEADWKVDRAYECTQALSEARFKFSDACGDATEATYTCVVQRSCDQIDAGTGCEPEATNADMICV